MTTQEQNIKFFKTLLSLADEVEYSASNNPDEGFFRFSIEDASVKINSPLTNGIKVNIHSKYKDYALYIEDYRSVQEDLEKLIKNHYYQINEEYNLSEKNLDTYLEIYKKALSGDTNSLLSDYDIFDFPNNNDIQIIDKKNQLSHTIQLEQAMSNPYRYETPTLINLLEINVVIEPVIDLTKDKSLLVNVLKEKKDIKICIPGYEIHRYPILFTSKSGQYISIKDPLINDSVEQLIENITKNTSAKNSLVAIYNHQKLSESINKEDKNIAPKHKL